MKILLILVLFTFVLSKKENHNHHGHHHHHHHHHHKNTFNIQVPGNSEVELIPSRGTVIFAIEILEKESKVAFEKANKLVTQAVENINKIIQSDSSSSIETGIFQIQLTYQYPNGQQTFVGYTVTNQLYVSTSQLNKIGDIITQGIESGLNRIDGVIYSNSNEENKQAQDQAMKLSIQDAHKQAQLIASQLNVKIVRVVGFEMNEYATNGVKGVSEPEAAGTAVAKGAPTPVFAQKQKVRRSVYVTYELKTKKKDGKK